MGTYRQLRELGFDKGDALLRTAAYKLSGLHLEKADIPEIIIGDNLSTLENLINPQYGSHARRPQEPTILGKTSRSHLDTILMGLHLNYRRHRDFFSKEMAQRYERTLQQVPESKKPLLEAINAIPQNTSPSDLSNYLRQIDERYVVKRNE